MREESVTVVNIVSDKGKHITTLTLDESQLTFLLEYAINGILRKEIKKRKKDIRNEEKEVL